MADNPNEHERVPSSGKRIEDPDEYLLKTFGEGFRNLRGLEIDKHRKKQKDATNRSSAAPRTDSTTSKPRSRG